ncbi:MAG: class I SAM-dependent methyltransferase, partial [Actinomycetota bacterium]|nr:class I SAM-dependent methyltransferase [Actinomycetota bacterium]
VRDTLAAARAELGDDLTRAARHADELEGRVLLLERRLRATGASRENALVSSPAAPASPAPPPGHGGAALDYFVFEARMRGSLDVIRERQRPYVEDFRGAAPVLDVGCGRGEFLQLLREAGIDARGVEIDDGMVAFCRGEGLDVEHADAVDYLQRLEDASLGGVFAAQVLEHLPPASIVRLLELAATKLRPGGILVAETINPVSPAALRNYFADLTHSQPLVAETLVLAAQQAGFARVDVRYLNEPPASERLRHVELPSEPPFESARADLYADVERLNEVLFAPLDYAVVART